MDEAARRTEESLHDWVARVAKTIDWANPARAYETAGTVLRYLASAACLESLLQRVLEDEALLRRGERFFLFDKIVLFYSESVRVRLHIIGEDIAEEVQHH